MAASDDYFEDPYAHEQLSDDAEGAVAVNVTEGIGQDAQPTQTETPQGQDDDEEDGQEDAEGDVAAPGAEGVVEDRSARGAVVDFAVRPSGINSPAPAPRRPTPEAVSDDVLVDARPRRRKRRAAEIVRTAFGLSGLSGYGLGQDDRVQLVKAAQALDKQATALEAQSVALVKAQPQVAHSLMQQAQASRTQATALRRKASAVPEPLIGPPGGPTRPSTKGPGDAMVLRALQAPPSPWPRRLLIGGGVLVVGMGAWFAWTRWFRKP